MRNFVMMRMIYGIAVALLVLISSVPVSAQMGAIAGTVTTVDTGQPTPGANIEVIADDGSTARQTVANANGDYRIDALAPGTYSIIITLIGHETIRIDGIRVLPGEVTRRAIILTPRAVVLNPVTVTASRRQEKRLDAPATVTILDREEISTEPAITPMDHLSGVPGVDIARSGLLSANIVTRGFNNLFSGAMLVLTDNRIASVPSLRVNAGYLIPLANQDIERIEVVLGPGAALYGPNSANGVMHIITRSPFESVGTSIGMAFGYRAESNARRNISSLNAPGSDRALYQGSFRHAASINDEWAYKISAQYMHGGDWRYFDPAEDRARSDKLAAARDSLMAAGLTGSALSQAVRAVADTLQIGQRNFTAERLAGEVRLDWRPNNDTEVIFSAGSSHLFHGIELTQIGAAQAEDWRYSYYQLRYRSGDLFAQAFLNTSDAGGTYLLRTGQRIVDYSRMFVSQVQHALTWGDRQVFTYGLDFQYTQPRTNGSINGRNEQIDDIIVTGGYLHSETELTQTLDLIAAARLDYHNQLPSLVFSPRAAVVYQPIETQSFRLTYNRAFSTPTTNNLFLDITAGTVPTSPIDTLKVQTIGVPAEGFHFRRNCGTALGGLCIRSQFAADPSQYMSVTEVTRFWPDLVATLRAVTGVDLSAIPAPSPSEVGSVLRVLNPTAENATELYSAPVSPSYVRDIAPLRAPIVQTFEVGYKGILGEQLLLTADAYYERRTDFIGPLIVESPNVFLDQEDLEAYLGQFIDAASAATAASFLSNLIPAGTITPDHRLTDSADLLITYRNFGEVAFWGGDIALQLLLGDHYSVQGSYSYVSQDFFPDEGIPLNAPQHNGSLSIGYENTRSGLSAEVSGRYVGAFPVISGVFMGEVNAYTAFDANVSYRLPFAPDATFTVSVRNALNNMHREFIGAPELGRLVLTRLRYTF